MQTDRTIAAAAFCTAVPSATLGVFSGLTSIPIGFFGDLLYAVSTVPGYESRGGEVLRGLRCTARPDLSALPSRGV